MSEDELRIQSDGQSVEVSSYEEPSVAPQIWLEVHNFESSAFIILSPEKARDLAAFLLRKADAIVAADTTTEPQDAETI